MLSKPWRDGAPASEGMKCIFLGQKMGGSERALEGLVMWRKEMKWAETHSWTKQDGTLRSQIWPKTGAEQGLGFHPAFPVQEYLTSLPSSFFLKILKGEILWDWCAHFPDLTAQTLKKYVQISGLNPCAAAYIHYLLSSLQLTGRRQDKPHGDRAELSKYLEAGGLLSTKPALLRS